MKVFGKMEIIENELFIGGVSTVELVKKLPFRQDLPAPLGCRHMFFRLWAERMMFPE